MDRQLNQELERLEERVRRYEECLEALETRAFHVRMHRKGFCSSSSSLVTIVSNVTGKVPDMCPACSLTGILNRHDDRSLEIRICEGRKRTRAAKRELGQSMLGTRQDDLFCGYAPGYGEKS